MTASGGPPTTSDLLALAFAEAVKACPDGYHTIEEYAEALGLSKRSTAEWLRAKNANKVKARKNGKVAWVYGI